MGSSKHLNSPSDSDSAAAAAPTPAPASSGDALIASGSVVPDSLVVGSSPQGVDTKKEKKGTAATKAKEKKTVQRKKKQLPDNAEPKEGSSRRGLKRAAACTDFREKSFRISRESSVVESKKVQSTEDEAAAISLTSENDEPRPNRRLRDFILHDSNGAPQPVEMLEVDDIFITGLILPLEESAGKEKEKGVRCLSFGRVETWSISGYDDGSPVVWISTELADYDCSKPAKSYKNIFDYFLNKAYASIEVYKKVSKSSGGDPDISLDELLAGLVRSLMGSKRFSSGATIKDFVVSQGEFIYNQLAGLDETAKKSEKSFAEIPVLVALRDESSRRGNSAQMRGNSSGGALKIYDKASKSDKVDAAEEDEKLAKVLQDEEYRKSMRTRRPGRPASSSNNFYIKINEDEIANDYPLPAYYKNSSEETDELIVFDADYEVYNTEDLPRSMLHDWALYNSDSRLISLELLPMRPCADIDVTIFGSGVMTDDDGNGFCLELDSTNSRGSQTVVPDGMPVFLSQIKEWMIEFGSSMIFISIRTDCAWYRLGKPSKQYAPWYEPVLKTARVAVGIITLLKEQTRIARLTFADVIKKMSELERDNVAYLSSDPEAVERYVVVHGQIILQLFAEYPDKEINRCQFIVGLATKMEQRHHTKWVIKKKKITEKEPNQNPRAGMVPVASKRKAMQATTTRLINRIWGEYYSNYSPEDTEMVNDEAKEEEEESEEQEETEEDDVDEDSHQSDEAEESHSAPMKIRSSSDNVEIVWDGETTGTMSSGEALYGRAIVGGYTVAVGGAVLLDVDASDELLAIYFIEYMFERSDGCKMFHGRHLQRGSRTVLGNTANERELFLTNECMDLELKNIKEIVLLEIRSRPWGHQYRKENANSDKLDRARAEERKRKDLPLEYYCKSLYWPQRGAFFSLRHADLGLGTGLCKSCAIREDEEKKEIFELNASKTGFLFNGVEYAIDDFVYVNDSYINKEKIENEIFKGGRNKGLRAYIVCQLLDIIVPKGTRKAEVYSTEVKVRRFFRPEDISSDKAYLSDVQEVYYSDETCVLNIEAIKGKCEVRKKNEVPSCNGYVISDHVFFCEHHYDPANGSLKMLSANAKLKFSAKTKKVDEDSGNKKGKRVESRADSVMKHEERRLATLDIFAGCGGLSDGLEHAGASETKWAIEYERPAGDAFKLNHPESTVFVNNCNVILRAIMEKCGDSDECISTAEAEELAASLAEDQKNALPLPGQVDFINGGPPCQGFSGMNRFNQSTWSKVQCEMILAFLSFADYFRPSYFLLENVRNFVSFNKGQTFRLTLASLLEMGYQVRFGILEAGAYGVAQSRKRAFIWAAAPDEILPEWPEPMHVFGVPELKISLSGGLHYAAVPSTANGAPFRPITVRDAIGELPPVTNGASNSNMEYESDAISWFQKRIRGDMAVLIDHISKEMNELNLIRCTKIPKRPGSDWRDLPDEKVKLSNGHLVDLIPWCLPNTAKRHNQWKGLFGRLDWEGNFPTSITDPQPMGKVGMCFHPEQDRILTVRECARSQGFRDSYEFAGNIQHKHRQIGNAVPPPLAYALGRMLRQALSD